MDDSLKESLKIFTSYLATHALVPNNLPKQKLTLMAEAESPGDGWAKVVKLVENDTIMAQRRKFDRFMV